MNRIFAKNAWLKSHSFCQRVMVEFDTHIISIRELAPDEAVPDDCLQVEWLTPGFINAHCHLEYTWLANRLPSGSIPFGEWMEAIINLRPSSEKDLQNRAGGMEDGVQAVLAGGCTTVIDSTTDGESGKYFSTAGMRHFLFHEVLGLSEERARATWDQAMDRLRQMAADQTGNPWCLGHGINPHAPYSVGPWLQEQLAKDEIARYPQAWHIAESQDEEKLFRNNTGSIAEFYSRHGMKSPREPGDVSSFEFILNRKLQSRCFMAFHGNYLGEHANFFCGNRVVVHCPGTHRWFSRQDNSFEDWWENGNPDVCLGTDSLASSSTLSMLDMIRITLEDNPEITGNEVLTMACTNPANVEFLKNRGLGSLQVGCVADFVALKNGSVVVDTKGDNEAQWKSLLINKDTAVSQVWIGGERRIAPR